MHKKITFTFKTALSRCCFYITHFTERKIIMDEKITTSATENAESTVQAEQAAATAQSGAQDGTATEAVTQSEPQAEQKSEPSGNSETGKADGKKSDSAESTGESDNSQEENKQEIAELKGKVHALSVGVAADCIEDVLALAKAKVGGDVTLDKAIDSVIEKYPSFKGEKPHKAIVTSAVATVNDEQKTADEARINKIMGIK
jgi:hypothetical protein